MMYETEDKYADIIHLPHHVSRNHPQMSMADRAAQFSPLPRSRDTIPLLPKPPASQTNGLFWMNQ